MATPRLADAMLMVAVAAFFLVLVLVVSLPHPAPLETRSGRIPPAACHVEPQPDWCATYNLRSTP